MSRAQRGHRDDAVLVDAAPDDHVDLDRRQPGLEGGVDPVEHARDREVDPVHRAEDLGVQRVEADGHPLQPGGHERSGQARAARSRSSSASGRSGPPSGRRRAASIAIRSGRSRRTSGSPPVMRSFSTPRPTERSGRPVRSPRSAGPARAAGIRSPARRPPSACSRCNGSCSGRSRRCADRASRARACPSRRAGRHRRRGDASAYRSPPAPGRRSASLTEAREIVLTAGAK